MNVAIIPARYNSKRIKKKNIKLFFSKPIIYWTIKKLIKSKIFKYIIVTSDSKKTLLIAKKSGANILILRKKKLSGDKTLTSTVINDAIRELNKVNIFPINICCVYPCNPFLLIKDLKTGLKNLKKYERFSFPVANYSHPIQRSIEIDSHLYGRPIFPKNMNQKTQSMKKRYFDAGQFYWGNFKIWKKYSNVHFYSKPLVIPSWRAIDIDNIEDWKRSEIMFKSFKTFFTKN